MAAPLPRQIFSVISLGLFTLGIYPHSGLRIAFLHSGRGNPRLGCKKWLVMMSEWVFVLFRLLRLAAMCALH